MLPKSSLELRSLLDELVADGRVSLDDADMVVRAPRTKAQVGLHPLNLIAVNKLQDLARPGKSLDIDQLLEWLGAKLEMPWRRLDPMRIKVAAVTQVMSFAYAKRHKILAVELAGDEVWVACTEPFLQGWEGNVEHVTRKRVRKLLADPADIERFTVEFYTLSKAVTGAEAGKSGGSSAGLANFEQLLELGSLKNPDANDQHIVNIVDWLLQYAFDQRASDIHVEPRRDVCKVRFRIDGVLYDVYEFPSVVGSAVTSRIKILGRMDVAEKRRPQDGRVKTVRPDGSEVELRLSTLPTAFGEKLVMRIFDPEVLLKSFSELGLAADDLKRWQTMTARPNGIVLVTGPTGSGKTTTLYTTLKQLATSAVNVCTIEDPIEMVEPAFNQMQVQHSIDLDFAAGVRALMRQDPDIIMVGEIRDLETAEMAIQAALTGHLVLSTLHTNDAPSAITRLLDIGVPAYLIKSTVLGIMAQRLVRVLCPHCKEKIPLDASAWQQLVTPWKVAPPEHMYRPVGCLECRNTGYRGRQGVYEILTLSEAVQPLVEPHADIRRIRLTSMKEGMRTLRLSGAQRVAAGLTTIEEVLRVAPPVEQ